MKRGQIHSTITRARVLQQISRSGSISRIEISRNLSMDRSTITHVINDLMGDGLVREELGASARTSGRKPVMITMSGKGGSLLGMEIQPGFSRITLMDIAGKVLLNEKWSCDSFVPGDIVTAYLESHDLTSYPPLLGITLALPGTVNPHEGILLESLALDMRDYPLTAAGESIPVLMDNDANCFARYVLSRDARSTRNMVCLIGESHRYGKSDFSARDDIGIGLIINGSVYYGSHFTAGEPGREPFYPKSLSRLEKQEETVYMEGLFRYLENTLFLLDPEVLFIGGELISLSRKNLELNRIVPPGCRVEYGKEDDFEIATGAALFFLERLLSPVLPGEEENYMDTIRWENLPGYMKQLKEYEYER